MGERKRKMEIPTNPWWGRDQEKKEMRKREEKKESKEKNQGESQDCWGHEGQEEDLVIRLDQG